MRRLSDSEVAEWVEQTLLSPTRTRPIVAVTSHPGSNRGWIDPDELQRELGESADVVFLETGDATWALCEALPTRLEVYGGAVRVWWPGLTRNSNPYEHRLHLLFDASAAERAHRDIVKAIQARHRPGVPTSPVAAETFDANAPPQSAKVSALSTQEAVVATTHGRGVIVEADLPLALLVSALDIGLELPVRPLRRLVDGSWQFSCRGLLPDPWQRLAAEIRPGDVVTGRVATLREELQIAYVDVLPGVVGACHIRQVDYAFVHRLAEHLQVGALLPFSVLKCDAEGRMLDLSRKQAFGQPVRPLPSLVEGGRPFVWQTDMPWFTNLRKQPRGTPVTILRTAGAQRAPEPIALAPDAQIEALTDELRAAHDDRQRLRDEIRLLRAQLGDSKRDKRSLEDRLAAHELAAAANDAASSERAFVEAVRVHHARVFGEDDRVRHPLQRMRVGREFLASLRATPGVELDKVVEVCAQIAAGIAHTLPGRDVHPLRDGSRGAGDRTRKRDAARAWRCALHQGPSAPRLRWWLVPGPEGATIEFANVCLHDEFGIAEA